MMFCAYLNDRSTWAQILTNHILVQSLRWLEEMPTVVELGNYILGESDFYANVHSYHTLQVSECHWESHEHTIDIQYIISGEENIRWIPDYLLFGKCKTLNGQDRLEWDAPLFNTNVITMKPGMFAIFMPREAHCPKIAPETPNMIRKAVVKVPIPLLEN
jgi:YhcH/YjgK/YiaL family protein